MDAEIRISPDDEFAALWRWLVGERSLAGAVRVVRRAPGETEMGGAFDLLAVALGSGGTGVTLARSLTAWLQTRRSNVKITVTSPSGSVMLEAEQVKDGEAAALLQEILRGRGEP